MKQAARIVALTLAALAASVVSVRADGSDPAVTGSSPFRGVAVSTAGTVVGTERGINLIPGTGVTMTAADNPGQKRVDVTVNTSGGGGGASALAVAIGTSAGFTNQISSPTGAGVFDQAMFTGQLTGGSTAFLTIRYAVTNVTSNYAITSTDTFVTADATGGSVTVTLPTAVGIKGRIYKVKRLNSGANTVTIATTSAQTIDGATTQVLTLQYTSVDLISDGSNWEIL